MVSTATHKRVVSDFNLGVKEYPPALELHWQVRFFLWSGGSLGLTDNPKHVQFSIKSPLFDFCYKGGLWFFSVQIKYMPNFGSMRVVAVKHGHS